MADGYVYVLVSANSEYVKIGKTEKHPFGQGADLLETRGWDDLACGVIVA